MSRKRFSTQTNEEADQYHSSMTQLKLFDDCIKQRTYDKIFPGGFVYMHEDSDFPLIEAMCDMGCFVVRERMGTPDLLTDFRNYFTETGCEPVSDLQLQIMRTSMLAKYIGIDTDVTAFLYPRFSLVYGVAFCDLGNPAAIRDRFMGDGLVLLSDLLEWLKGFYYGDGFKEFAEAYEEAYGEENMSPWLNYNEFPDDCVWKIHGL